MYFCTEDLNKMRNFVKFIICIIVCATAFACNGKDDNLFFFIGLLTSIYCAYEVLLALANSADNETFITNTSTFNFPVFDTSFSSVSLYQEPRKYKYKSDKAIIKDIVKNFEPKNNITLLESHIDDNYVKSTPKEVKKEETIEPNVLYSTIIGCLRAIYKEEHKVKGIIQTINVDDCGDCVVIRYTKDDLPKEELKKAISFLKDNQDFDVEFIKTDYTSIIEYYNLMHK